MIVTMTTLTQISGTTSGRRERHGNDNKGSDDCGTGKQRFQSIRKYQEYDVFAGSFFCC
jgi:hypothetical protein